MLLRRRFQQHQVVSNGPLPMGVPLHTVFVVVASGQLWVLVVLLVVKHSEVLLVLLVLVLLQLEQQTERLFDCVEWIVAVVVVEGELPTKRN